VQAGASRDGWCGGNDGRAEKGVSEGDGSLGLWPRCDDGGGVKCGFGCVAAATFVAF